MRLTLLLMFLWSTVLAPNPVIPIVLPPNPTVLAKVIHAEARGQGLIGMYLVGSVAVNRWNDPTWDRPLDQVLFKDGQFAAPSDTFTELSMEAALLAIERPYPRILYFYNPRTATDTAFTNSTRKCFDVGDHRFCEESIKRP